MVSEVCQCLERKTRKGKIGEGEERKIRRRQEESRGREEGSGTKDETYKW